MVRQQKKPADAADQVPAKDIIDALKPLAKPRQKVVVFLGNGINASSQDLSTKAIVSGFVRKAAAANPRAYEVTKEAVKRLASCVEPSGSSLDMAAFLGDVKEMEDIKEDFMSYVIESCCLERPTESHLWVLVLCTLLRNLGRKQHQVAAFTTNYDNLLERAYLRNGGAEGQRHRLFMSASFYYADRFYAIAREHLLRPKYSLVVARGKKVLPVIPLHGSICVCRCPGCRRELTTEAAALERKRCVYCGADLPRVIVPTREGEADKEVLGLFEDWISRAAATFFIGYGYTDPHIIERIKRGFLRHKNARSVRPVSICHEQFPADKMDSSRLGAAINITADMPQGLLQLLLAIAPRVKPASPLLDLLKYTSELGLAQQPSTRD